MLGTILGTLLMTGTTAAKLPPATAKEMTAIIVAINKALGLENWEVEGEKACVDRGGLEATIKDVSAEDAKNCAASAIERGFPGLGKEYAIGIPMASIGPVTVFAIGKEDAEGWGAYSCDPSRKCNPTKLSATSKQAKRLVERYQRACSDAKTIWFPNREGICEGMPITRGNEPSTPVPAAAPSAAKKPTGAAPSAPPWPVKQ